MIQQETITVIVQGAIDDKLTKQCLASIRKHLPKSHLILSTWENSNLDGLDFDTLVLSQDPGSTISDYKHNVANNVNRQIVSSANGLKATNTIYALKLRSDMLLTGLNFITYFNKFSDFRNPECKVFKSRVVINNLYCTNPIKSKYLFHISDWTQFGLTTDLINLWDIKLQSNEEATYFLGKPRPIQSKHDSWLSKYIPEQFIWSSVLEKNNIITNFQNFCDYDDKKLALSRLSIANNFIVLNYESFGIKFLKYDPYKWDFRAQTNHSLWLKDYKYFCDQRFKTPFYHKIIQIMSSIKFSKFQRKTAKNLKYFLLPFIYILIWLRSPFSVIIYSIILVFLLLRSPFIKNPAD